MSADKIPQSVIVIDNDQLVQSMVKGYLTKAGTTKIVQCRNGQEALQAFQKDRFDLIIMDWKLKQPTGPEMFKALKTNPDTVMVPLILSAGQFTKNDVAIFKKFPGTSFVMKPFSEDALLMSVAKTHPGAHPKKVKEREKKKNSFAARLAAAQVAAKNKQNTGKQIAAPTAGKMTNEKEEMFHLKGGQNARPDGDMQNFGVGGNGGSGMFVAKGDGQAGLSLMHDRKDQMPGGNGTFVDKRDLQPGGLDLQTFSAGEGPANQNGEGGTDETYSGPSGWGASDESAPPPAEGVADGPLGWGTANDLKLESPETPTGFDLKIEATKHETNDANQELRFNANDLTHTGDAANGGSLDFATKPQEDDNEFAAAMAKAVITRPSSAEQGQTGNPDWTPGSNAKSADPTSNDYNESAETKEDEDGKFKGNAFAGLFADLDDNKPKPKNPAAKKIIPMFGRTNPFAPTNPDEGDAQQPGTNPAPSFDFASAVQQALTAPTQEQSQNEATAPRDANDETMRPQVPSWSNGSAATETPKTGADLMMDPLGLSQLPTGQATTSTAPVPLNPTSGEDNRPPATNDLLASASADVGVPTGNDSPTSTSGMPTGTSTMGNILDGDSNTGTPTPQRTLTIGQTRLRSALIVERDISLRRIVEKYLGEMGVNRVVSYGDGQEAWNKFAAENFDMVMLDWKSPTLSGLAFYNRMRKDKVKFATPIVITCGFVKKQDFRVFEDNPCVSFIEKPFQLPILDKGITQLVTQVTEYNSLIKDVVGYLQSPDNSGKPLVAQMEGLLRKFTNPVPALLASGQFLFSKQRWDDAEKVFKLAFSIDKKNVSTLTWLGKVYHKLNRVDEALRILQKAEGLSPENIERLCLLGEVGISLKDPAKAKSYFQKAMVIDKDDQKAKAGIVLAENLQDYLSTYQGTEEVANKFSSVLNIVGITYVRNKQYDKGVTQYHAAMSFTEDAETLARLEFNLGLAYLRSKKYAEAKDWFSRAAVTGGPGYTKPGEFLQKLEAYMGTGRVDLANGNKQLEMVEIDEEEIFAA